MPEPSYRPGTRDPDDLGDDPVAESAGRFRQQLGEHLSARVELLGIEAEEARIVLSRRAKIAIYAGSLLAAGYLLVLISAISLLGSFLENIWPAIGGAGWQLVAILAGCLHGFVALALVRRLKRDDSPPLFEFSRAELHKDCAWLRQRKSTKSESENEHSH